MSTVTPTNPQTTEPQPPKRKLGSREAWLLGVCCVAQFMVILDLSIVNVALPSIQLSLNFTAPELQWIVDAYAITFAGFLMLGGRAADHFGQRKMFVLALLLFGLASLAGGIANDRTTLIAARAAQGLGGALMAACSLAVITSSFAPGPKLNRAIGAWAAMNGLGGAAGMLFGGLITQELNWRWVLLINPPIAIVAAVIAYAVVSERRRAPGRTFDLAGALTLTIGQMVLVFGVVEAGLAGWDTTAALGPIIGGIALLGVFVAIETWIASEPLIPFKELTKPLRVANNIVLLFSASLFPMWFVSSLYLQQVLGLSPLHTGLIFLPMTLMIMAVASRAGKLVGQFGVKAVLGGGLILLTGGMLLLARIGASGSPIVYIMIPGLLTAAGIALSIVPSTIAATQGAKEGQAGLASGLVNTSRQIGGGLGLAVLVTLATQHSSQLIGAGALVPQALTDGFRLAYLIGAGLAVAAALVTFTAMAKPDKAGSARPLALAIAAVLVVFVAVDLAFAGSHGAPVGAYTTKGAYSFVTEPTLHPPKLQTEGRTPNHGAGAGIHLHRQLLQPQLSPAGRPERPVDPRPRPAAGVVRAGARKGGGLQSEPANLRRQAGARLVAGGRHEHGPDRERRIRDRQPALSTCRPPERQGRLGLDAARDRDQRRRRVGDGQQEHRQGPVEVRRRLQRGADRLGGAGVQPEDGQAVAAAGTRSITFRWRTPTPACRRTGSRGTPTTSTRSR